jgi:hypothetical protein
MPRYVALPHACVPPGLRCSRSRFLRWDADETIQGSSVDHDLCCDNEACRRGGLLGHHGGGGAFREPETWAICRSNRAVGWS